MKILVVNNGSHSPKHILSLIEMYEVQVVSRDCIPDNKIVDTFDLVILTGSSSHPIVYNFDILEVELQLIRNRKKPLIGICYGCELLAVAFGSTLKDVGAENKKQGMFEIHTSVPHPMFLGIDTFYAYEAHRWCIDTVGSYLEVLAESKSGPEIIKHKKLPLYGFQFHPEKETVKSFGDELFYRLISEFTNVS